MHAVIDVPAELVAPAAAFWSQALGWRAGSTWPGHPELRSFEPVGGHAYVHLQQIGGPARTHIDVEVTDLGRERRRLVELGATVGQAQDGWQPMASPGALPFCLVEASEHVAPAAVEWPDGHRTRLVQVCIDSPPGLHESEVEFWRAALGWRWVGSDSPEFAGKLHDDQGSPLQLLFQRLDADGGPVRAHLDLGSNQIEAEVQRLVALGAVRLWSGDGWVALRDPVGMVFCVTGNSPDPGTARA